MYIIKGFPLNKTKVNVSSYTKVIPLRHDVPVEVCSGVSVHTDIALYLYLLFSALWWSVQDFLGRKTFGQSSCHPQPLTVHRHHKLVVTWRASEPMIMAETASKPKCSLAKGLSDKSRSKTRLNFGLGLNGGKNGDEV